MYAAIGVPHCPNCGIEISRQSTDQILEQVMTLGSQERVMILAPIARGRKGEYKKELDKLAAQERIEGFVATNKHKHGYQLQPCQRGPLPRGATAVEQMQRKLTTKVGAAVYTMRKVIVEPVFGQIKQVRGFRQFLLRGLEKVQGEWALVCLTHNILKLHRICYG